MKRVIASALALAALASCATSPPPCTTEWVHWKTDKFVAEFVAGHARELKQARDSSLIFSGMGGIDTSRGIPMMLLTAGGVLTLATDFMRDLWPEVRDAVAECQTAPRRPALRRHSARTGRQRARGPGGRGSGHAAGQGQLSRDRAAQPRGLT